MADILIGVLAYLLIAVAVFVGIVALRIGAFDPDENNGVTYGLFWLAFALVCLAYLYVNETSSGYLHVVLAFVVLLLAGALGVRLPSWSSKTITDEA